MNQRYDLLAMSLMFSAAALIAFTAVDGTVSIAGLKEWQTLCAAIVAVGAATIAYRGAMAKVALDREIAARNERRRSVGIALRLGYAMELLTHDAGTIERRLKTLAETRAIRAIDCNLHPPIELEEAWSNLDALPRDIAFAIASLRACFRSLNLYFEALASDPIWTISPFNVNDPPEVRVTSNIMKDIVRLGTTIRDRLGAEYRA